MRHDFLALLLLVALPIAAEGQDPLGRGAAGPGADNSMARCEDPVPEVALGGCTTLIESGKATSKDLVVGFVNRGIASFRLGDNDGAIQDFDQAIKLDPKQAKAFNNRGNAYTVKGDYEKAFRDYGRAIELDPKYALA